MSEELVVHQDDDLESRPREEIEEAARKWFAVAADLKSVQDELVADLETALNLVRTYQRLWAESETPDPGFVKARQLLTKYKMAYTPAAKTARVYVSGVDITEHPDSFPGSADEVTLPEPDRLELVMTEDGKMHLRPVYDELEPEELAVLEGEVADE